MTRTTAASVSLLSSLLIAIVAGCTSEPSEDNGVYEGVMSFDTARVRLARASDTLQLTLELAVSAEQRSMGLMERRQLADTAGMLFIYDTDQPPEAGFWMYRTRIPLDIAFLDSAGVIRVVRAMTPCAATIAAGCPTYAPDVPYRYALEVNAGVFARQGVAVGHTLLLSDVPVATARSDVQPKPQ